MAGEPAIRDNNGVPTLIAVDPSITENQNPDERGNSVRRLHVLEDPVNVGGQDYNVLMVYDVNSSATGGTEFDDGAAIDTNSQGTLILGSTDVPGTARVIIVDDDGHLQVDILTAPTITIQDGGNVITVDGTVNAVLSEPISVDDNAGSLTIDTDAGAIDVQAVNLDIRDLTSVSDSVSAVQGTTPWTVAGAAAHDAAVSGNPVRIGGRSNDSVPTEVTADNEAVDAWFTRNGKQVVLRGAPNITSAIGQGLGPNGGTPHVLIAAPGSNLSIYIVSMVVSNEGGIALCEFQRKPSMGGNVTIFPYVVGTQGAGPLMHQFQTWLQVTNNNGLDVLITNVGVSNAEVHVLVEYFVAAA